MPSRDAVPEDLAPLHLTPRDLTTMRRRAENARVDPPLSTPFGIGYVVRGADGSVDAVRVLITAERVTLDDRVEEADVTMTCDAATAGSLAHNGLSVQRAVLDGRLELAGDLGRLSEHPNLARIVGEVMSGA